MHTNKQQVGPAFAWRMMALVGLLLGHGLAQAADLATYATDEPKAAAFRTEMRALWQDQCILTRAVENSVAGNLPDLVRNHQRLVQNQVEIGNAVRPYLGDTIAEQFTALLQEQVNRACATFTTAKNGNVTAQAACWSRWQAATENLALFLSTVESVNWHQEAVPETLRALATATAEEIDCRIDEDWSKDAAAFRVANQYAVAMADLLSDGIISQFPDKFAGSVTSAAVRPASAAVVTSAGAMPTSSGAEVVFTLAAASTVGVEITNIAGRPVRRLAAGYQATEGLNTLLWNGTSDGGLHVPNGTYIITIRAASAGGTTSQAATTLYVSR